MGAFSIYWFVGGTLAMICYACDELHHFYLHFIAWQHYLRPVLWENPVFRATDLPVFGAAFMWTNLSLLKGSFFWKGISFGMAECWRSPIFSYTFYLFIPETVICMNRLKIHDLRQLIFFKVMGWLMNDPDRWLPTGIRHFSLLYVAFQSQSHGFYWNVWFPSNKSINYHFYHFSAYDANIFAWNPSNSSPSIDLQPFYFHPNYVICKNLNRTHSRQSQSIIGQFQLSLILLTTQPGVPQKPSASLLNAT